MYSVNAENYPSGNIKSFVELIQLKNRNLWINVRKSKNKLKNTKILVTRENLNRGKNSWSTIKSRRRTSYHQSGVMSFELQTLVICYSTIKDTSRME